MSRRRFGLFKFHSHPAARQCVLGLEPLEARRLLAADITARSHFQDLPVVPGEILVQYREMPSLSAYQDFREVTEGTILRSLHTPMMKAAGLGTLDRVRLGGGIEMQAALESLRRNPLVEFAEPNYRVSRTSVSNDPAYLSGLLWGLYGDDAPSAVGPSGTTNAFGTAAEEAWQLGYTGSQDVIIGVIDEGLQFNHPDLAANIWVNPFEIPGDGIDNDGNGYRDDIYGWDAASNDNSIYDGPQDDHGTHVAGTIGAVGGNGVGVAGVAWNVKVINAKFFGPSGGSVADAVEAIDYLTDLKVRHGIRLVATNNSWGGDFYSQAIHDAVIRSAKADILFIAAAGNSAANTDTSYFFPANANSTIGTTTETAASFDNVISVAALASNGALASFSNYSATQVDLAAPGVGVYSTMPAGGYGTMSGTSMAAPHVAGAAALLASLNLPDFGAEEIKSAILNSVTLTPALAGKTATGGRLNVPNAIQYAIESRRYVRFDQAFYGIDQTAVVESRDSMANVDPSQVDQISVWIQSTSDPVGKELVLQETAPNSSIFVGMIDLVSGSSSASDELVVATGDSIVASRAAAGLQSTSVVRGAVGTLISGSLLGDTLVATYTGTGTTNQWNVTRNGQTIFTETLTNDASLWIEGLGGDDTLLIDAGSRDNQIVFDANQISVDGFSILVSRIEKVRIAGGAGNDRLTVGNATVEFDGGTGTDRLQLLSGNRLWNITGAGNGTVDSSIPFTSVEWALGGTGNDSFIFASAGTMTGGIAGGDGTDLIDLSAKSAAQTINLTGGSSSSFGVMSEVERVVGGLSKADQLLAPNAANQWTLNGIDSGILNGVLGFESFENLTGGSDTDLFQVAGSATISGTVSGAGGIDQLDLSARQGGLEFRAGSLSLIVGIIAGFRTIEQVMGNGDVGSYLRGADTANTWSTTVTGQIIIGGVTYAAIGSIVGGNGIDTLAGPIATNRWTLSGANTGTWQTGSALVRFSAVENLTGSSSVDTFVVEASGSLTGTINGGAGVDELNVSARAGALDFRLGAVASLVGVLGGFAQIEQVVGNGASGTRVTGANVATSWAITATGQISVGGATYSSVGSIVGGTGIDTLSGPVATNRWTLGGANAGTWQTGASLVGFSGVENLTGNSSVDTFVVESSGTLTGTIQGGAGVDELNVSARAGALDFRLGAVASLVGLLGGYTQIEQVVGNGVSGTRVTGANVTTSWAITASGQISVGGVTYSSVGSMVGGTGIDTLSGPVATNRWTLSGANAGTWQTGASLVGFSGVENLTGNSSVDTFVVESSGTLTGTIQGGAGVDELNVSARAGALDFRLGAVASLVGVLGGYTQLEQVVGNGVSGTRVTGANVTTSWAITASGQISVGGATYSSVGSIVGGTGIDTLTGPVAANRWTIQGPNLGTLQTGSSAFSFSGVENLTGNSGVDTFVVESSGTLTGTIQGGAGVDELNVSARAGALDFRLGAVASLVAVLGGYTQIEQVLGNGAVGSRVAGANGPTTWATTVSGQILVAGVTYSSVGAIVGGTGIDTLTGPAAANDWTVTSNNAGSIQSGTATVSFSGVESLVGNSSIDQFQMEVLGSLTGSLQGGAGVNSLSYAGWTTPVVVNLASTLANNATAISGVVTGIQIVVGGAGNDILTASSVASVLVGMDGNDQLTGGGQRDLLIGGVGADRLVANAGDDILISGIVVFGQNVAALRDVHSEWTSGRTFDQRVANLMGTGVSPRLNGENYLNMDAADGIVDTVFADLSSDTLTGGSQQDWFFADLAEVVDLVVSGTSPDRRDG